MNKNFEILLHIYEARRDNAGDVATRVIWETALDTLWYAINGDNDLLQQFDYLLTQNEVEIGVGL